MKKIVVLSGAGISAESGLRTFRDSNGLWENHRIEDVATPEAWQRDPDLVLEFYNLRRKQAQDALPNAGHLALKRLEDYFDVTIITQNVDDLHEKAGSSNVLHLHGELFKSRSTVDEHLVYSIEGWELKRGDLCEKGSQLRPHIVWFGEAVPMMETAIEITYQADLFIVVGTSLVVYPAAGLVDFVRPGVPVYVIDPNVPEIRTRKNLTFIPEAATTGLTRLAEQLIASAGT
ncbi:SIR2 family NAD-dependent protein deacylase [Larkinella soli]|uniref:SIR2 family NAD-dependent protein deacylase n=1 Tax=Larkinella soli TaxID=1770527 RepID=UPI000FFB3E37|nr:NAD-dependent deacylase [Larkinella soli]